MLLKPKKKTSKEIFIKGRIPLEIQEEILTKFKIKNTINLIGFFIDYSKYDILVDAIFDKFTLNNISNGINWKLICVTDLTFFYHDMIEEGYKTISIFEVKSDFSLIEKIPIIKDWYDNSSVMVQIS